MNKIYKGENQSKTVFGITEQNKYRGREKSIDNRTIQTNVKQRTISNAPLQRGQNGNRIPLVRNTNVPTVNQHLTSQTYKMQLDKTRYNSSNKKPPIPTAQNHLNERMPQKGQNMHKTDSFQGTSNYQHLNKAQDSKKLQEVEIKQEIRGIRQKSETQAQNEKRINEIFNTNNTQKSNEVKHYKNVASLSHYETTTHNTGNYHLPQNQANININEYIRRNSIEQEKVKDPSLQKNQEMIQKQEEKKENLASIGKQKTSAQQYGDRIQQQPYDYINPTRQKDQDSQQATTNGSIFAYNQFEKKSQNTLEMKNQENEIKEAKKLGKQQQGVENQNTEEEKLELSETQKKHRQFEKNSGQGLVGLNNIGNTCFMNSILQCLLHTPALAEYFLNNQHIDELNKKAKMRGELARAYGEFVYTCKKSRNHSTVSPTQIKSLIGKYSPQFIGFAQQDSQELLRFLLDGLHEDLNRVKQKARYKELSSDARQIGEAKLAQI